MTDEAGRSEAEWSVVEHARRELVTALAAEAEAAWEAQEWAAAGDAYERLFMALPEGAGDELRYEAALAYKFARNWKKALDFGREAAAHAERGTQDPAYWNLGIAATIERDWDTARDAWRGFGLEIPDGTGPIEVDYGMCCVRIADGADGAEGQEVVWVRRLCPTRARIVSVPFGDRRFGEVVVHDGAPNGGRLVNGREYPVFDELMLFEPSDTPTWRITVTGAEEADIADLEQRFMEAGLAAEATSATRFICQCCDHGTVETDKSRPSGSVDLAAAAPDEATARELLEGWAAESPGARGWHSVHLKG